MISDVKPIIYVYICSLSIVHPQLPITPLPPLPKPPANCFKGTFRKTWKFLRGLIRSNQSINQISILPISTEEPGSVSRQRNQCSTEKRMKQLCNINGSSGVSLKLRLIQRDMSVDVSWSNWWMGGQQEVFPNRWGKRVKSSCTCVGLYPRELYTNSIVWSQ